MQHASTWLLSAAAAMGAAACEASEPVAGEASAEDATAGTSAISTASETTAPAGSFGDAEDEGAATVASSSDASDAKNDVRAYKIDPETYEMEWYEGLHSPYTYSDMTGGQLANVTCNTPPG